MKTEFLFNDKTYSFYRYPANRQHDTLQAWGAEDEYALAHCQEHIADLGRLLILNDDFGFLGCLLNDATPIWQQDSYVAHSALRENLARNQLVSKGQVISSTEEYQDNFDTVLLKLPRNQNYLVHQLQTLRKHISPATRIIAFGKVKAVTSNVLQVFESIIGPTTTSLAVKKSRLIFCQPDGQKLSSTKVRKTAQHWSVALPNTNTSFTLTNLANVFSGQSLDIGARFMLQHLQIKPGERVLDLGCGNGVLGLQALTLSPESTVSFVDESFMAVESARQNVANNIPEAVEQCQFIVDNCLDKHQNGEITQTYDVVLCNPPFHQQNTITDHIAWQMFSDAKAVLRQGGRLVVVGNRHLGYHDKLKRLFGGTKVLASQPKFVILVANKR